MRDDHPVATPLPPAAPVTGETSEPGHCPNCGRFVGPYERCPYCGADVGRRMAVRAFKYGSLLLGVVGVALLLLVAPRSQVPKLEIGRLRETMNWAYVGLEGVVTRQPSLDAETGTLTLWMGDGTGEILVMAYRPEAEKMMALGALPVMGDGIRLEGTLRIKEDLTYLVLNVPEAAEIWPLEPVEVPVVKVETCSLYQTVKIQGVIRDEREPYEGVRILAVRDASGEIDVALHSGAAAMAEPWPELQIGQSVAVTGAVDRYRDTPQLSVGRGSDVVVLEKAIAIAPERQISQLSSTARSELVVVSGTIVQIQHFSSGVKLALDDGSGTVTILLWQDLYDSLTERELLVEGAVVRVLGELAEYQGELEIVPEQAGDLSILAVSEPFATGPPASEELPGPEAAEAAEPPLDEGERGIGAEAEVPTAEPTVGAPTAVAPGPTERHLGELSAGDVGQWVQVEGVLRSLRTFSAGVRGVLDDGTGTVTLLVWQQVWDALPDRASLGPGAVLQVEGEVNVYEGELEVIPREGSGVMVVGQVDLGPEERDIGGITNGDVGQTVEVVGSVVEVQFFSKGVKYVLGDGSGQITLLLWQNLLEEVASRHALVPGSQVRVTGEIEEYEGNLEIVPGGGAEVRLLARSEGLPVEERAVNTISAADEGRAFTVMGRVTRAESIGWLKLWIEDGTGELLIFVPQRVVDYLPTGIGPGIRVRVTGEVDIYEGQLELIPLAGADIEVP